MCAFDVLGRAQCVAVCYIVWQCVAVRDSVSQCVCCFGTFGRERAHIMKREPARERERARDRECVDECERERDREREGKIESEIERKNDRGRWFCCERSAPQCAATHCDTLRHTATHCTAL